MSYKTQLKPQKREKKSPKLNQKCPIKPNKNQKKPQTPKMSHENTIKTPQKPKKLNQKISIQNLKQENSKIIPKISQLQLSLCDKNIPKIRKIGFLGIWGKQSRKET